MHPAPPHSESEDLPEGMPWVEIVRTVTGEGAAEDLSALRQWQGEDPQRQQMVDRLQAVWAVDLAAGPVVADVERIRRGVRVAVTVPPAMAERSVGRPSGTSRQAPSTSWRNAAIRWMGRATAVTLVALIAFVAVQNLPVLLQRGHEAPVTTKEYRTAVGQRARLTLPDSSSVVLAPPKPPPVCNRR